MLLIAGIVLAVLIWQRGTGILGKVGVILGCTVLLAFAFAAQCRPAEIIFARLTEVVRMPGSTVLESRAEYVDLYGSNVLERGEDRDGEFMSFPVEADPADALALGELLIAVQLPEVEKAYSKRKLREQNPISDRVGGRDILLVLTPSCCTISRAIGPTPPRACGRCCAGALPREDACLGRGAGGCSRGPGHLSALPRPDVGAEDGASERPYPGPRFL